MLQPHLQFFIQPLHINVRKQEQLLFQETSKDRLIEVWQNKQHRWLSIDSVEQSRLNIESSEQIASPLDYHFLCCLLFTGTPRNILLAGLGGGTLAHYFHNKHPEINGHAIEINPLIAKLAKKYFNFPQKNWDITIGDIQFTTIHNNKHSHYDLIFFDIGDKKLTPKWLVSSNMLLQLKHQLSEDGCLAINLLVTNAASFSQKLTIIRKIFDRQTLCLSIPDHDNIIVFAFNKKSIYHSTDELQARIKKLSTHWKIDYLALLRRIQKENPEGSGAF